MKRIYIPLFWKFTIAIIFIVAVFGSINAILIWNNIYNSLENELEKRGLFIASNLASQTVNPILYDDYITIQKQIDELNKNDVNVYYAFILNSENQVVAHTFSFNVPKDLINANTLTETKGKNSVLIIPKNTDKIIKDIAFPILNGDAGVVRIGIEEEGIKAEVNKTIYTLMLMVCVFLIAGISGAFVFSYFITKPIKLISITSDKIDLNTLSSVAVNRIRIRDKLLGRWKPLFRAEDELDLLADKFNGMIERLEMTFEELKQTQSSLIQSEKLATIGSLVAGIAHEINNPLSGLQNCIRRISKNPDNIKQNEKYFDLMMNASNKIEQVIISLLNYSRKQDIRLEPVDLIKVIESALLLAGHKLEKERITVDKNFDTRNSVILGSKNHLEQVLVNLIINSIDAIVSKKTAFREITSKIIFELSSDDNFVYLSVKDTGTGIPEEDLPKIFDPFYTSKETGEGTGLGLSVSYNIIQQHNGEIKVKSIYGKGSEFIIKLIKHHL